MSAALTEDLQTENVFEFSVSILAKPKRDNYRDIWFVPRRQAVRSMLKLLSTIAKITIASILTGVVLAKLNLSAEQILLELGMTPENVIQWVERGMTWAVPHLILGSLVIVPVWLVVYLFRPPRS